MLEWGFPRSLCFWTAYPPASSILAVIALHRHHTTWEHLCLQARRPNKQQHPLGENQFLCCQEGTIATTLLLCKFANYPASDIWYVGSKHQLNSRKLTLETHGYVWMKLLWANCSQDIWRQACHIAKTLLKCKLWMILNGCWAWHEATYCRRGGIYLKNNWSYCSLKN